MTRSLESDAEHRHPAGWKRDSRTSLKSCFHLPGEQPPREISPLAGPPSFQGSTLCKFWHNLQKRSWELLISTHAKEFSWDRQGQPDSGFLLFVPHLPVLSIWGMLPQVWGGTRGIGDWFQCSCMQSMSLALGVISQPLGWYFSTETDLALVRGLKVESYLELCRGPM